jgi:hypothetical protein
MSVRMPMGPFAEVFYLQLQETVRSVCDEHGLELVPSALRELDDRSDSLLSKRPRARQVLAPFPPFERRRFFPHVLYWTDAPTPQMLDERAAQRQPADDLLSLAINAGVSKTRCRSCGTRYRSVRYEGSEPLLLGIDTSSRVFPFIDRCPSCGSEIGSGIVDMLFEIHEQPET